MVCMRLCSIGRALGIRYRSPRSASGANGRALNGVPLERARELSGIDLPGEMVEVASRAALALTLLSAVGCSLVCVFLLGPDLLIVLPVLVVVAPLLAFEAVHGHPARLAARRAEDVLRDSMRCTNLMIMSLRHEPSLSKAIRFASRGASAFAHELRGCIWSVIMAEHASFEETLQRLGDMWVTKSPELKTSLDALITASCESTEEGKRRALDRANNAMVSGAKHRIEEYALSLSTPSMIMFGLGILLPLMVGSFLPMLSWDLWSMEDMGSDSELIGSGRTTLQTMFVMNILFPAVALFVALTTTSRHPLRAKGRRGTGALHPADVAACIAISLALAVLSAWALAGQLRGAAVLLSVTVPGSALLVARGWGRGGRRARERSMGVEDALFKAGARMTEGENLETALSRTASTMTGASGPGLRAHVLRALALGWEEDHAGRSGEDSDADGNAMDGLRMVQAAASKDEGAAGILAMDLAAYLKDLRDLDRTLRMRLRPMVSMMKMTSYALSPVVLGVTFAIYLSLGEIAGSGASTGGAEAFFLVLGFFLAETNAVVMFFVWSLEGGKSTGELMHSIGACVLSSEAVYVAASFVAAS